MIVKKNRIVRTWTKRKLACVALLAIAATTAVLATPMSADAARRGRVDAIILVTSQGLYYDSVVTGPLPLVGPFQELVVTPNGLQTMYGPGQRGYVGGRWWVDANGNRMMDMGDMFFSCPLLGPGRLMP